MGSYGVLPADRYKVVSKSMLSDIDRKNILTLYGPIIGSLAVTLYFALWNDLNTDLEDSEFLLHHHLLSVLKCSSKSLKEARESLEAVGLVKSFVKEENVLVYLYELYSPLYPQDFLNHPILSTVLYNNLGADEYEKLIKAEKKKKVDYTDFIEITKQMDDVYEAGNIKEVTDFKTRNTGDIKLTSKIDYELISQSIPNLSDKAFNKKTKELIDNLSFIYNADTLKMIEYIRASINEFGLVDKTTLRATARKSYELSSNSLPTIIYRTQPEYLKQAEGDNSAYAKVINMFENVTPYEFLKKKNNGASPTNKTVRLIESLLVDLELTPAVVNVLIDYCLNVNNNKLTNAYVETIAEEWKRAGLKTAKEAMTYAKKEHKKMMKKKSEVKPNAKSQEPVWFDKDIKKEEVSEEEEQELNDLLKEFKDGENN